MNNLIFEGYLNPKEYVRLRERHCLRFSLPVYILFIALITCDCLVLFLLQETLRMSLFITLSLVLGIPLLILHYFYGNCIRPQPRYDVQVYKEDNLVTIKTSRTLSGRNIIEIRVKKFCIRYNHLYIQEKWNKATYLPKDLISYFEHTSDSK